MVDAVSNTGSGGVGAPSAQRIPSIAPAIGFKP